MTGPEHYRKAERLLHDSLGGQDRELSEDMQRRAQVHATLALAAATGNNEAGHGQTAHESNAWFRVAGVKPEPEATS